jgi:hypothetical protein
MNELHNIVIRPPQKKITDTLATIRGDIEFLKYNGLIIRKISFVKVDVFGTSIDDTASHTANLIEKSANSIHVKTNDRILRQHLLFKEGDVIDPRVLADNERLYRELRYLEDAKILVNPVPFPEGFADVVIIVKDQWSMAFYIELTELNAGRVEIWDRNIFGTGNEIQNNVHWNTDKPETWGYEAIYNTRNILGTFVDSRFHYTSVFDTRGYGIEFNRKFFTPDTKYAGGATAQFKSSPQRIWNSDTGYFTQPVSCNTSDLWIGRSVKLNKNAELGKNRLNLILATRIYKQRYFDRPLVNINRYYDFQNKTVWLNTLALSSQSFYQSNLIYNYGRTEDVPIGYIFNLTTGPEFGEFENRYYSSLSFAHGNYINQLGYLYFMIEDGGFIAKSGNFEQAMFQLRVKYFSNLIIFGQFKFRQFINLNFTKGIKRFEDERITINDKNGLRGFNEPNVMGQQRFVMNWETVAFSPYFVYGFRFTFFAYADLALLGPEAVNLIYEDVYSGFGLGTRIQNERLVFPAFSFRFGFYPNLKDLPYSERIRFSGEPRLNPDNFYLTNPSMINYQ